MKKNFTLVELIVVIAILAILSSIIIPNISSMKSKSIVSMVNSNIRIFQTAVDTYALDHDGKVPTAIPPSLGEPQLIQINELYPSYIKTLPKEKEISKQNYWVDYTGRVWGATVDSPSDIYMSNTNIEWSNQKNTIGYNVYEVKNKATSTVNTKTFSLKQEILLAGMPDKVKFDLSEGNHDYLISAIDQYGLETAPVSLDYDGKPQGEPILMQEGEFYYEIHSEETLYWDNFKAIEEKPEGTDIEYSFAVSDDANSLNNFESDFSTLDPAKHMRIKIHMISHQGKYPSLYDLRVFYHYADETVLTSKRVAESATKVTDEVKLANNQYVDQIRLTDSYDYGSKPSSAYTYSTNGSTFNPVTAISDIPAGSYVRIEREGGNVTFKDPIVTATTEPSVVQSGNEVGGGGNGGTTPAPVDKELQDKSWETFQTLSFFASAADGQLTHWIRADIVDEQPENTRILYRYSTSNGNGFGNAVDSVEKLSDSRMLKVTVYLQVKKEFNTQPERSKLISLKIVHSRGVVDLSTVKPSGTIMLNKSNNKATDEISVDTKITWDYEAFDPQDKKIIEVQWGGDKREQYTTPGTYTVTLKLRNELNYWSDTITYKFDVKAEKPVAVLKPDRTVFSGKMPIQWDTSSSYDPDNDGIKKIEWGGDYRNDNIYPVGQHTITMRVQDNEGNWSDSVSKTFTTINSVFYNIDTNALDDDLNTSATLGMWMTHTIYWDGDLTNRVVSLTISRSSGTNPLNVLDKNGNKLSFINALTGEVTTDLLYGATKQTYKIIMPANAYSMTEIHNGYTSIFYDVSVAEASPFPNPITNISSSSTKSAITLNWIKDETVAKVMVYRDGVYIGSSTTTSYVDKPLLPNKTYVYNLIPVHENGNAGSRQSYSATTLTPIVSFKGIDAAAFDDDLSTSVTLGTWTTHTITWDGDLTNRVVSLTISRSSGTNPLNVFDKNGNKLTFINALTGAAITDLTYGATKQTYKIIMPANAYSISETHNGYTSVFYDVSIVETNDFPNQISNATSSPTTSSLTLNWTKDSTVSKVLIYRNGVYINSSTGTSYVDKPLYANTTYTYDFVSIHENGNASSKFTTSFKTVTPEIAFKGIAAEAFDGDMNTYATLGTWTTHIITWDGNIAGKTVGITATRSSGTAPINVFDASGNKLSFINADTGLTITDLSYNATKKTYKIIMPANAASIRETHNGYTSNFYEVAIVE